MASTKGKTMKITKRQYTKELNDLMTRRNITANYLNKVIDNIQYVGRVLTDDEVAKINRLHDQVADLEQQMKDLEDRWNRRNWTSADYDSYALVAANID